MSQYLYSVGGRLASPSHRPYIAIPVGERLAIHSALVVRLWESKDVLLNSGIDADFAIYHGNCHVDDTRNEFVRRFLMSECDQLVMIDSDVLWQANDLRRLIEYKEPIVGGVYPKKTEEGVHFTVSIDPEDELEYTDEGLLTLKKMGLPTGFIKIRREVLETMYKPALKFRGTIDDLNPGMIAIPKIFYREVVDVDVETNEGTGLGGDINFSRKAREDFGYRVCADMDCQLKHLGEKAFAFGTAHDYLKIERGMHREEFAEAINAIRGGDPQFSDFYRLWKWYGNHKFSATPELLEALYYEAKNAGSDHFILECGSGISSIVMGLANPDAEIVCMEDQIYYAQWAAEFAKEWGLDNVLIMSTLLDDDGWYVLPHDMPGKFSLVVIDGPQRTRGNRLEIFNHLKFSPVTRFVIDDWNESYLPYIDPDYVGEKFATGVLRCLPLETSNEPSESQPEIASS